MREKIKIEDDSGDRKYFTIIPNYILNHSTMWDREVYVQMKRITGEKGTCWTSRNTLAKQCGMSPRRLDKSLQYLIAHRWIEKTGVRKVVTRGGEQEVNEYRVADLWKMNADYYESLKGVAPETPPYSKGVARNTQRGSTDEAKGIAPGATKEEPLIQRRSLQAETSSAGVEKESSAIKGKGWNQLIDSFEPINPMYRDFYTNKTERTALEKMVAQIGFEKLLATVQALPGITSQKYAPKITKPSELRRDFGKLLAFYKQNENSSKVITI